MHPSLIKLDCWKHIENSLPYTGLQTSRLVARVIFLSTRSLYRHQKVTFHERIKFNLFLPFQGKDFRPERKAQVWFCALRLDFVS